MPEKTKLTVRVDARALDAAKSYAASHRTSLSRLISGFLDNLAQDDERPADAPILRRLTGILPPDLSPADHKAHLARKYGG